MAVAAAKSEIMQGDKLNIQAAAVAKNEIMKKDKLGRQGGSSSQERNHKRKQAWETRR